MENGVYNGQLRLLVSFQLGVIPKIMLLKSYSCSYTLFVKSKIYLAWIQQTCSWTLQFRGFVQQALHIRTACLGSYDALY